MAQGLIFIQPLESSPLQKRVGFFLGTIIPGHTTVSSNNENKLDKSKATGLDRLIRECADLICKPISEIFNQSIIQGVFADDWKCARVTPLFKEGDRDDLNNYRPISVIPVVAKVFEKIVYDHLSYYLEEACPSIRFSCNSLDGHGSS